jgi:SAM-dependent methyltransferase
MKELIPWWARIGGKLVLSRVPAGYTLWHKVNLFTHGAMDKSEYALGVFQKHFMRSGLSQGHGFVALELGPGDSLSSAMIAAAHGATLTHLVDVGQFATSDMAVYQDVARLLRARGFDALEVEAAGDVDALLQACHGRYYTRGLESLREIHSASVDFIWSHAVLEHLRRHEFADAMRETRRLLRSGGVCSHQIDLRDHLGGALNNMRIPTRWWEADWMARSGFYTNRLRKSEMIRIFESVGFAVEVVVTDHWERLPTPRHALAREFQDVGLDDLLVKGFQVVLRPI